MVKPGIPAWAVYGDRAHRRNLINSIYCPSRSSRRTPPLLAKYAAITWPSSAPTSSLCRRVDAGDRLQHRRRCEGRRAGASPPRLRVGLFRRSRLAVPHPALLRCSSASSASSWSRRATASSSELRLALSNAGSTAAADRTRAPLRRHAAGQANRGQVLAAEECTRERLSFYDRFERHATARAQGHSTHYCRAAARAAHKFLAEAIDELGIQDAPSRVAGGLQRLPVLLLRRRNTQAAHGRAGGGDRHKTANPDSIVISYRGRRPRLDWPRRDRRHGAARHPISVIFINNAIYG